MTLCCIAVLSFSYITLRYYATLRCYALLLHAMLHITVLRYLIYAIASFIVLCYYYLTVVEWLPRMGQRVRDVPTPPVLITSPLPAQYDLTSTDPSILCLHHPPGRQPGRWRRQGGRRRGSWRQQCSHSGCVYVCSLCERVCACILHCITSSSLHVSRKVFIFAD